MTTVTADALVTTRERRAMVVSPALAVAAVSSIGAGAIHAAAIGVHSEHRQAVVAFTLLAAVQLGWGVLALLYANRWLALAGAAANTAAVVGWVMAKTSGISFIDGFEASEGVQFADFTAMALAAIAVIGAVVFAATGLRATRIGRPTLAISAVLVTVIAIPAMISAGSHSHAGGHGHGGAAGAAGHDDAAGAAGGDGHGHAVIAPVEYDPNKPIDLGGVEGVTPEQQARAENLIAITLLRLPQWDDYKVAEAAGFESIGDGFTGHEHFLNVDYFDDGQVLNPDRPESLVYEPQPDGTKKLVSAMYMLAPGETLAEVPDVGGELTQWHIHNNLCFTTGGQVAGLTNAEGACNTPLVKGPEQPMIHVWITKHPCGPFAALEGVGAGQIKEGETRLCDAAHGGH